MTTTNVGGHIALLLAGLCTSWEPAERGGRIVKFYSWLCRCKNRMTGRCQLSVIASTDRMGALIRNSQWVTSFFSELFRAEWADWELANAQISAKIAFPIFSCILSWKFHKKSQKLTTNLSKMEFRNSIIFKFVRWQCFPEVKYGGGLSVGGVENGRWTNTSPLSLASALQITTMLQHRVNNNWNGPRFLLSFPMIVNGAWWEYWLKDWAKRTAWELAQDWLSGGNDSAEDEERGADFRSLLQGWVWQQLGLCAPHCIVAATKRPSVLRFNARDL